MELVRDFQQEVAINFIENTKIKMDIHHYGYMSKN